jgi:hypothetical protein
MEGEVAPLVTQNPGPHPHVLCGVGKRCVPKGWMILILAVAIAAAVLCLYGLWAFWPESVATTGATGASSGSSNVVKIVAFTEHFTITSEQQLFAIVALAGALGGIVHTLRSLGKFIGNRRLRWSWVAFYLTLPLVGAATSTIVYIVTRAGLFPSGDTAQVNVFGFAAVATLVGLFSEEAMNMLKKVASTVFTEPDKGADPALPAPNQPVVDVDEQ